MTRIVPHHHESGYSALGSFMARGARSSNSPRRNNSGGPAWYAKNRKDFARHRWTGRMTPGNEELSEISGRSQMLEMEELAFRSAHSMCIDALSHLGALSVLGLIFLTTVRRKRELRASRYSTLESLDCFQNEDEVIGTASNSGPHWSAAGILLILR